MGLLFSSFDYQNAWKSLENEAVRNPKTALKKLDAIEKQAKNEKNVPQQLRCILSRMKFSERVDEDALGKCINSLQLFQSRQTDPVAVAMARFAEGMAFNSFYQRKQWTIDRRTALSGKAPSDMKEWATNNFVDTIRSLCLQVVGEPALKKTMAADFSTLFEKGDDSHLYQPTLYDFLVYYCIENKGAGKGALFSDDECERWLADLTAFHKGDADKSAYAYARIQQLKNLYLNGNRDRDDKQFIEGLRLLLAETDKQAASVLVRVELATALYEHTGNDAETQHASAIEVLNICNEGLAAYPKHPLAKCLRAVAHNMKRPMLALEMKRGVVHADDKVEFKVTYSNRTSFSLSVNQILCSAREWNQTDHKGHKRRKIADYTFSLDKADYCIKDTSLSIPALPFGIYELVVDKEEVSFLVSNQYLMALQHPMDDKMCFVSVDSKTGAPRAGVKTELVKDVSSWKSGRYEHGYEKVFSGVTGNDGFFSFNVDHGNGDYICFFSEGNDSYSSISSYLNVDAHSHVRDNAVARKISTFTDRSIYRPGQTVYFKSVAYSIQPEGVNALADEKLKAVLYDANHQKVSDLSLVTNEFGSAASSFVIPASGLAGKYMLEVNGFSTFISVEEYKRPSFEVTLNRPTASYTFGDRVTVKGSASYLLGTPVQNAKVAYTVRRSENVFFWWWRPASVNEEVVAEGETQTGENGGYEIAFVPEKGTNQKSTVCYDYVVLAKVTDANGETHEQLVRIAVSDQSLAIVCPKREVCLPDELAKLKFSVVNLNCEGLEREVAYKVYGNGAEVAAGKVLSSAKDGFSLPLNTAILKSGKFRVEFTVTDDHNKVVSQNFETVLYRKSDKVPPVEVPFWFEEPGSCELADGEVCTVRAGSSLRNAHLLVVTSNDQDKMLNRQWYDLDNEIKSFNFSLANSACMKVQFILVHNGEMTDRLLTFNRKAPDTRLPIRLSVFRDKVQPGSTEKWTLTLPADKKAEVLAAMYDASLDQIMGHQWNLSPAYRRYFDIPSLRGYDFASPWLHSAGKLESTDYRLSFYRWKDFFRSYHLVHYCLSLSGGFADDRVANAPKSMRSAKAAMPVAEEQAVMAAADMDYGDNGAVKEQPHVRTNFAETAFFYPQLTSDKDGNVQLNFTMPESLTRWKLMALAHSKDLYTGSLTQEVVSQKDFMVSPNYPRFLRNGDECVLSAKVVNLSDAALKGSSTLQLLDPVTEKVIVESDSKFELAPGQNAAVEWPVSVPQQVEALLVRVVAKSGAFSDAEQKLLPVLSSRVVLTQSQPMWVRGGKTKDFTLDRLVNNNSKTLSSRFLKLEMATNPVWYAVQALPSVAVVEHDNAISLSAAYFASKLANHIAVSNPKIFKVIELWKQQSADKETLLSNLEKNQEVKNVLLNETPWVMDAKSETERKQRLASLFDLNTLAANCNGWLKRLAELQTDEGGYAWFKGMKAGSHSTLFVLDNFGRLQKAGISVASQDGNIKRAVNFLDNQVRKNYEWLVKYDKNYKENAHIGMFELYYFQVRSLFSNIKLPADCATAYNFYYGLMKKQWDQCSLYGKALAAIALYRGGDKDEARLVARSLREFSTTTDEMGMFWQKNVSGYFWQDAAISTHTRIMEALHLVDNQQAEQDELRVWLLNQKRTQNWDNVIANVDALNVLLLNGSDWISHENKITVKMAGKTVKPEKTEVGTGYFSVVVPGDGVKPEMGKLQLESAQGDNLAWGALYWQFEEDIDKVLSNKTGLHVEKTVMLNTVKNGKEVLSEVSNKTLLKVGDKLVVRLVLRTDRDLEYVSLKDQRASCLEPLQQISGYRYSEGTGYYQSAKDAAMYYFFEHLSKGTYVFEYPLFVTNKGRFSNGITTVQCLYAPEFLSNTGSVRIQVK
ncbi:MAG: hypothetical protein K6G31_04710 [Paludibacteraceae bacterium]|nr:hypothetical protein [Paludibacteraceae bacterium]